MGNKLNIYHSSKNLIFTVYKSFYFATTKLFVNFKIIIIMQKIKLLSIIAATILCTSALSQTTALQPSGNIVTKDFIVNSFNAIKAAGLYELILTQGSTEAVKVEADDNMQQYFTVSNNGSELVIDMPNLRDKNFNIHTNKDKSKNIQWKVYVTFKTLKSIDVSVIGNVHSESMVKSDAFDISSKNVGNINLNLNTNKLSVNNEGVGNITLAGTATNAEIKNSGVGQFEGDNLVVQTMNIANTGVGNAHVNVQKDITIKQSFLGKVSNKGAAAKHEMDGVEM